MSEAHRHRADVVKRLRRAEGHLRGVIALAEADAPCLRLAEQLHAVERAVAAAKRLVIEDHLEHCLDAALSTEGAAARAAAAEFRDIVKHL